ncbi:MAG TPA: ASCH domain-containing protein, partial [Rhizomicrobium sp.]|nr:ASCH domain-containing protein [Rhizomicrobium sp.]
MTVILEKTLERFAFGDSPEMADALLALVLSGNKTATCAPLREYEQEGVPLPQPGERSIVLDGDNNPVCMIETINVAVRPFDAVDADFARAEGEGDLSLAAWRTIHREFFDR